MLQQDAQSPQFTTAEYSQKPGGNSCKACKQAITARFYRVNNHTVCESCTERLRHELPQDTHSAYMRALLFGAGGAVLGLILYAGFTIITGIYLGYVALAVGWLVGKAVTTGSGGVGGKRYQIAAVLLTYAAVSLAEIPIYINAAAKQRAVISAAKTQSPSTIAPEAQQDSTTPSEEATPAAETKPVKPARSFASMLGTLALIGLASPFLELQDPVHGIIGLIILFVGIRIAWQVARGKHSAEIQGPYDSSAAASV